MTIMLSYSIRRSPFSAPTIGEILDGPILTDRTGTLATTDLFMTAKDANIGGPAHEGSCGFKQGGVVFFPSTPTLLQEGAEVVEQGLDQLPLPALFELAGLAFNIYAEAKSQPRTARDYLADPRTFVLPFLDVVEVSVVKADHTRLLQDWSAYEVLVACDDGSTGPRHYRFRERGPAWRHEKSDALAHVIISMRVVNDLDAAEADVLRRELDPYVATARDGLRAKYGDLEEREHLVLAQARQLRRQTLQRSGTPVVEHLKARVHEGLGDLILEYQRVPGLLSGLEERHQRLLS